MADCYVAIIGGGIIGNAIAYELSRSLDPETICLIEKNPHFPGENQTSRNSGVVHAGIYYDSSHSPLKASLCVEGSQLLYQFCQTHQLPIKKTGKLVVAADETQDRSLDDLLIRAQKNGVPDVKKIDSQETKELEPNVKAYSALWVPSSGIVDPTAVVRQLKVLSPIEYFLGTTVTKITPQDQEFVIGVSTVSEEYDFSAEYVINAAGLHSDEIARMVNPEFPLTIFPVRGEAAKFYQARQNLKVSRNIYPAPIFYQKPDGSEHLTVGVHLTPTFSAGSDGDFKQDQDSFLLGHEVTAGPLNRKKGPEVGKQDLTSDLAPTSTFLDQIKPYFPGIKIDDLHLHQTGIQAVLANSQDFHIAPDQHRPNMINLVGICSPGLTAALAIAKKVKDDFFKKFTCTSSYSSIR